MPNLLPADLFVQRTAASYGEIPVGSPRVTKNMTFNISSANAQSQWLSTGLYAAPGETITVTVPASLVNQGWEIKISSHDDDVTPRTSFSVRVSG
jgi:N-terminal domain of M60-like peptidases